MGKPKVAFFDNTCCEGCQLQVLSCEDELLELFSRVEVVNFREAMTERSDDYEIAFIEGSITTPHEVERLKLIREHAKTLVALGQCATTGGVNYLKNFQDLEEVRRYVYGENAGHFETLPTMPVEAVVKVDYWIFGCPIRKEDFLRITKQILLGKPPEIPRFPVCVECRQKENVCMFEKGKYCLGPLTRGGGCDAWCPSYGFRCYGCRGIMDDPNSNAELDLLKKYGYTVDDLVADLRMFDGYREAKSAR